MEVAFTTTQSARRSGARHRMIRLRSPGGWSGGEQEVEEEFESVLEERGSKRPRRGTDRMFFLSCPLFSFVQREGRRRRGGPT